MFAGSAGLWRSLAQVRRMPLAWQPFVILGMFLSVVAWTAAAGIVCALRLLAVIAGQAAFVAGVVLCLLGFGLVGLPLGVTGLIASRAAA